LELSYQTSWNRCTKFSFTRKRRFSERSSCLPCLIRLGSEARRGAAPFPAASAWPVSRCTRARRQSWSRLQTRRSIPPRLPARTASGSTILRWTPQPRLFPKSLAEFHLVILIRPSSFVNRTLVDW